jgi:steroid delta-isomerase-like uncharacterized protein
MDNKIRSLAEGAAAAWSSHDAEKIASFFTEDCIFEDVCSGDSYSGQEALKKQANAVFTAIPDLQLKIVSLFSEGDWLGCEWIETGSKDGKRFSVRGVSIVELEKGKIRRESIYCHFDGATWFDS